MAQSASPEPRCDHESGLIGDELHLFGGRKGYKYYFPRNEIWTCNVREKKKWIRRFAEGKNIPPPCYGARCVVINGIMYSYGGWKEGGGYLGEVFGFDPKEMKWIQVATPVHRKKPWQRCYCCFWAIGGRMIMFGGGSVKIPPDRLQSGAQCDGYVNNEIYEFVLEEGGVKGYWVDVALSGKRPQPRCCSALETIDRHRGLLHGGGDSYKLLDDAFVMDLRENKWICIDFLPKPSARSSHGMCRLVKRGFERKNIFLIIGGYEKVHSDSGYAIDFDEQKSHKIDLPPDFSPVWYHTVHCVANQDGSSHLILSGGQEREGEFSQMMKIFILGPSSESNTKIESLLPAGSTLIPSPPDRRSILDGQQQMESMRLESFQGIQVHNRYYTFVKTFRTQYETLQPQSYPQRRIESLSAYFQAEKERFEAEKNEIWMQLQSQREAFQTLQKSLDESRSSLNQFVQVLSIPSEQIQLTQNKLGTGSYADVFWGFWHGMHVAVKKFHDLINTEETIPLFQSAVLAASRLHHPNIVRVCGAIMRPSLSFQIVSELLEGSVSEVINAAHSSGSYLSNYEQLSIAVDMTSAISYLHELHPRPYVHGDICLTNALVTRIMTVKVAYFGSAHLLGDSLSSGPNSALYVAPERLPPTSESSAMPSDVYSLGVSLIEIFIGVGPIPEERNGQLNRIMNRGPLHAICSRMIEERDSRPTTLECLAILREELANCLKCESSPKRRLVKGEFEEKEGGNRCHRVVLFEDRNVLPDPYLEKATIDSVFQIGNLHVPLNSISPLVSAELTQKGIDMTIAVNKCSLSIPPEAVEDPIVVSSCLLSDNEKYKSETGEVLTDVVELLPHGTKLQKAATLKLKHNFALRKKHRIKVTLLYQSGTELKKVLKPLCVFTALNQVVSFRFGSATLVADKIIVRTKSFCWICGENNGCCIKLSEMVFSPTDLSPSQFRQGFAVKLCICGASEEKEDTVIKRECKRTPHEVEMLEKREFSLCDCDISKDKGPPVLPLFAKINEFQPAAGWTVRGSYKVDFRKLRAIFKGDLLYEPYYFAIGLSDKSLDVSDTVNVWFTLECKERIDLLATFRAKNPELSHPKRSLSHQECLGSPIESELDCMVTEEELNRLAPLLPDHWKNLARKLKVSVKHVETTHRNESQEHPYRMLNEWRCSNGSDATVRLLCTALFDVGHRLAAEMVFPCASKRLLRKSTPSLSS